MHGNRTWKDMCRDAAIERSWQKWLMPGSGLTTLMVFENPASELRDANRHLRGVTGLGEGRRDRQWLRGIAQ
jgi:hypothetical protein